MRTIRDCRVAVVGGCGFLGSHVTDLLIEKRGCEVLVIDNLVAGRIDFLHPQSTFEYHDIWGSKGHTKELLDGTD